MTPRRQPTEPRKSSKENTLHLLRLFVYGTLKRGYWNHDAFFHGVLDVRDAQVRGRLYEGPGFPLLEVPDEDILAYGTANHLADVATQAGLSDWVGFRPRPPDRRPNVPQRAPGAPCTGSCSPSTTLKPGCRPSTAWRASARSVPASIGACSSRSQ